MWNARITIVMLLLGVGLLGAYFGVHGQDPRLPWPSPPVMPPAKYEKSEPPPPRPQVRPPAALPVKPPENILPNSVVPANYETKVAAAHVAPAPSPIQVEPPPPAPTPSIQSGHHVEEPALKMDGNRPSAPAPSGTSIKTISDDKASEPLIVLPRTDINLADLAPPGPKPAAMAVAPPPTLEPLPSQPMPKTVTSPEVKIAPHNPQPALQETAPSTPPPAKPRAFQLVNPIRRQENNVAAAPFDPPSLSERSVIQAQPVAQTNPIGPAPLITGNATAQIAIEKRGPANRRAGEPLQFTIVLRNVGLTPAAQLRVEDEIPPGTRVISAEPQPVVQSDRAVWVLAGLPPGGEKQLKVELEAKGGGELMSTTSVWVSATAGMRTRIDANILSVAVKPSAAVPAGSPVVIEVQVTNHSQQALTGLVLHGSLPAGLTHPAGKEIEADVGDLGPSATKMYKMPVTAARPGRHTVLVTISTPAGLEAQGQTTVQVTQGTGAGLSIQQPAIVKLFLDKEAEFRIDVTNHQVQGLNNVAVLDSLPDGVEFIAASDRGLFRPDARLAHWLIDYLAPGQTKTLTLRVQAKSAGQFANNVTARTEAQQTTQSSAQVQVEGIADLMVKVTDRENPIEVGKTAVYEIKVTNQGSVAATGVQVQATLSEGMAQAKARGPTPHRVEGRQVTFASLPKLQPQGQAVYYVMALAQMPGAQRCRAEVVSDQVVTPISREERTFVYRD